MLNDIEMARGSLSISFNDVKKHFLGSNSISYRDYKELFSKDISDNAEYIFRTTRGDDVLIKQRFDRKSNVIISVVHPYDDIPLIGYAHVKKPRSGQVFIDDVRMLNADYIGVGIGRELHDHVDRVLEPIGVKLKPSPVMLEPKGRDFWMKRNPKALALRDLYKQFCIGSSEQHKIEPEHILYDLFSGPS